MPNAKHFPPEDLVHRVLRSRAGSRRPIACAACAGSARGPSGLAEPRGDARQIDGRRYTHLLTWGAIVELYGLTAGGC